MINSDTLIQLRQKLHQHPELSGTERATSETILHELSKHEPDQIMENVGGHGIVAVYHPKKGDPARTVLFRAELDAIAVNEESGRDYHSVKEGVMHGCGHDGHMAILTGVAQNLNRKRPENTAVYLLYQPAEETGQGAGAVLGDPRFDQLKIDHGFALHNLPGFEEGKVILADGLFALASTGIAITFKGRSSHAAYPEEGLNPVMHVTRLIDHFLDRFKPIQKRDPHAKAVVAYIRLGEIAFGVNPGVAKVGFTIRASDDRSIEEMTEWVGEHMDGGSIPFEGEISFEAVEPFAATINTKAGNRIVQKSAEAAGMATEKLRKPFPWSEDFGSFRRKFPVTLFGLGAGCDHPPLHSERYDFNDRLIQKGVQIYGSILSEMDQPESS